MEAFVQVDIIPEGLEEVECKYIFVLILSQKVGLIDF
jgi:hypothetical protein